MADDPNAPQQETKAEKEARDMTVKTGLAMELPFTIVGSILLGGFLGFLLDRWLHTSPGFLIAGGMFGFIGIIIEIVRRFRPR
jgi:F0F1-type ATP synthase assembly protein I